MIELRVRVTRENAEKVIQLIRELVGSESVFIAGTDGPEMQMTKVMPPENLRIPPALGELTSGQVILTDTAKQVGTWGQFNSFFPIKAVLRVLAHLMNENRNGQISLQVLVDKSIYAFKTAGLHRFRGFPKKYKRESAIGRLVWHFITTACQIGLIRIEGDTRIPTHDWDHVYLSITKEGFEFCSLDNRLLDWNGTEQVLTDVEKSWIINYLKKIDNEGFKEYSLLKGVFEELKKGNINISGWLEGNENFRDYVSSWSRKKEDTGEFAKQMKTVAIMFAQSKIAILRELGAVSKRRKDYTTTGSLGD